MTEFGLEWIDKELNLGEKTDSSKFGKITVNGDNWNTTSRDLKFSVLIRKLMRGSIDKSLYLRCQEDSD